MSNRPSLSDKLQTCLSWAESINTVLGALISWLVIVMAIIVFVIVAMRGLFDIGSIALQESVTYMHAAIIMLCLASTLKADGHVRVDIFYRRFSAENKAWVGAIGSVLFLLPFAIFLIFVSWEYTVRSWSIRETSSDPGGIPAVFLLKTLIPLGGGLLCLQGTCDAIRKLLIISFKHED